MAVAIRSQSAPTITASGTSIVIDMPAGIQAGDYLIAFIHYQGSGSSTDLSSAGWTRIGAAFSASDTAARVTGMFARVATGSETSTYTFGGVSPGARIVGFAVAFTGVDTANPVAYSSPWYKAATNSNTLSVSAEASTADLYTLEIWASNFASPNSYALTSYDGGLTLIGDGFNPAGAENTGVSRSALRVWGGVAPGGGVPAHTIVTSGTNTQRCAYLVSLNASTGGGAGNTIPTVVGHTTATSSSTGGTFTVDPTIGVSGSGVATGDWIILTLTSSGNLANTKQPTAPGDWTNIVPFGTVGSGTMTFGMWAHQRAGGETTYTWTQTTAETQNTSQRMIFVRNAQDIAEWVIGSEGTRAASGGTTTTTAPSITTTLAYSLGLLVAVERTTAAESDAQVTCDNFTKQWFENTVDHTIFVATKDMTAAGATGTSTITYPNTHAQNGAALILGIPGTTVASDPEASFMAASYRSDYTTTTVTKSVQVTTLPGDLVIVCGAVHRADETLQVPTGNGLTFTGYSGQSDPNYASAPMWTAFDTVGGTNWTLSVSRAQTATQVWGFSVFVFRNIDSIGVRGGATANGSSPDAPYTPVESNSILMFFAVDGTAVDGASRVWDVVGDGAPGSGNGREVEYQYVPGQLTVYGGFYGDAGTGETFYGLNTPSSIYGEMVILELYRNTDPYGLEIKTSDGSSLVDSRLQLADGSGAFTLPGAYKAVRPGYSSVTQMLAQATFYCAHRGGTLDYPEMSLYAYGQSALLGYPALELSLARTSDGVWFGLHDSTLDRTSGVSGVTAASLTWAQVQTYNILGSVATNNPTQSDRPYMRWEEIIALYYPSHVIFVDPKVALSYHTELITMMNALPGTPTDHFVAKYFGEGNSGGWPANARSAGYKTWGYYYAGGAWATWQHLFDILGMDYSAPSGDWTSILSHGKPVMGHIAPNAAAVTTALGKGAAGVMVSGVKVNIPPAIT